MNKLKIKSVPILVYTMLFCVYSSGILGLLIKPYVPKKVQNIINSTTPKKASAENMYSPSSVSVTQGTQITDINYGAISNGAAAPALHVGSHFRMLTTASGIDATVTFSNVNLNSANMLYVNYDGSVSSSSLTYQLQIWDFYNDVWRNIVPHDTNLNNTGESASGLITQVTAAVDNGFKFPIYDGYFSNGSNTPISTPVTYFVENNEAKIRIYSAVSTPNYELRVDYLSLEPAIENMRFASSMTIAANGGSLSGEYNDTTTDDASGLTLTAGSAGVDAYFSFTNLPTPYTGANTILVEYSGLKDGNLADYNIYIWDFTNTQWDRLSNTNMVNTSDASNYFASDPAQFANYISGNEIQVRVYSSDTSGIATVDYVRVTVGSTATNSGFYTGEITRGGSPTNTVTDTQTLDTTTASTSWQIPTSIIDTRTTTEYSGDCGTYNYSCAAANIKLPVDVPANTMVTGVHFAFRYSISSASIDLEFGILDKRLGRTAVTSAAADETALKMMYRTASYPMQSQIGTDPIATIPIYQPHTYVNTIDDAVNVYVRTAATAVNTAQTFYWDFAFVSIRYIGPEKSITNTWTTTSATLNYGTNTTSNYRYTITDDNSFYVVTADGTNGTDLYLSFTNITIPTNANKLIIYAPLRWSVISTAFDLQLYDFTTGGGTWRSVVPHQTTFTSGAANSEEMIQLEIYNGYFSDTANTKVNTPLSYFVSSSELRLRIVSTSTSSNLSWDWAAVEFAVDPAYFPSALTPASGTTLTSGEYNDLTTDGGCTAPNVCPILTYASSLTADLTFSNVLTPPAGSNAVYYVFSGFKTTITDYSLSLRNFGGGSCAAGYEAFNGTVLSNTTDATNYFVKAITDWSCYISSGTMEVRLTTNQTIGGTITLDFAKLVLGSVNTDSAGYNLDLGGTYSNGSLAYARTMDTSTTFDANLHSWRIRTYPNTTNGRVYDAPSVFAGRIDFPITLPANSMATSLIWMWKGANSANTAIVPYPTFINKGNYYSDATNYKLSLTAINALPDSTAAVPVTETTTLNTSTQSVREGWYGMNIVVSTPVTYSYNLPNAIDTETNETTFRFRTTSTSFTTAAFNLDAVFVALRYVD